MNGLTENTKSPGFVGVELSRRLIRVAVLDSSATQVIDYVECLTEDPISPEVTPNPASALSVAWRKLKLNEFEGYKVCVSVGSKHSGVGSGPAIADWIDSLETQIGKKISQSGEPDKGVSYYPYKNICDIVSAFKEIGVVPDRIELAPISVARVLPAGSTCSIMVDSSIGWRARLHSGHVLEALAYPEGLDHRGVLVEMPGMESAPLENLVGIDIDSDILTRSRADVDILAIAVGAALSFANNSVDRNNLVESLDLTDPALCADHVAVDQNRVRIFNTQELEVVPSSALGEVANSVSAGLSDGANKQDVLEVTPESARHTPDTEHDVAGDAHEPSEAAMLQDLEEPVEALDEVQDSAPPLPSLDQINAEQLQISGEVPEVSISEPVDGKENISEPEVVESSFPPMPDSSKGLETTVEDDSSVSPEVHSSNGQVSQTDSAVESDDTARSLDDISLLDQLEKLETESTPNELRWPTTEELQAIVPTPDTSETPVVTDMGNEALDDRLNQFVAEGHSEDNSGLPVSSISTPPLPGQKYTLEAKSSDSTNSSKPAASDSENSLLLVLFIVACLIGVAVIGYFTIS